MKSHCQIHIARCIAAGALAFSATGAFAQASTAPEAPASAASPPRPAAPNGPRLRSAAETGNRAVAPGDLHPERPVAPQISVPFGKKPAPPTKREEGVVERGNARSRGGVDDASARCEAQVDDQMRATCRATLAREVKARAPI